jgi:SAM-dependent methyltransferase
MTSETISQQVRRYYESRLAEHGPTARGVDWNSEDSQRVRFGDLYRLLDADPDASVLDYGCGYGALAQYARERGHRGAYTGFDLSEGMIAAARESAGSEGCTFVSRHEALPVVDYTVASGIFNVRQSVPVEAWRPYVLETIGDLARLSRRGFGFNALSTYSDPERRRDDLYYADPLELFDHCHRRFSRRVALLHDSPLYEFTLLVRL